MKKFLEVIFITILTSLYIFPFNSSLLPTVNTKMMLAAISLILFIIKAAKTGNAKVSSQKLILSFWGVAVSLVSLISVVINNTHDYVFVTYIVSMWVWLGGAYVVIETIRFVHGRVDFRIVGNYLIAVCVAQCFLSQIINANETVANFVDGFMVSTGFMGKAENRLYGIGCALDVAGMKFCTVLILLAYFIASPVSKYRPHFERTLYILAFFIISIFGAMIARTTFWGIVLAVCLWIFQYFRLPKNSDEYMTFVSSIRSLVLFIILSLPVIIYFYYADESFHNNLRFGFEGFFSLAEKGEWHVRSNKQLLSMVVWPDNFRTWLIGDGYFENPMNDFYYDGPLYNYYMGTDVGYCRFIFYFGLLGLVTFSAFFVVAAFLCTQNNPKYAFVFWLFLLMNFIVWVKVSSDLFSVFALFLFVQEKNECYSNEVVE